MKKYQQQNPEQFLESLNFFCSITKQIQFDSMSSLLIEVNSYFNQLNYASISDIFDLSPQEWFAVSNYVLRLNLRNSLYFCGLTKFIAMSM